MVSHKINDLDFYRRHLAFSGDTYHHNNLVEKLTIVTFGDIYRRHNNLTGTFMKDTFR